MTHCEKSHVTAVRAAINGYPFRIGEPLVNQVFNVQHLVFNLHLQLYK